ncbi:MAG TPA: LacI family DNA-binding transcriptional regulator [Devosiaceae bacterium]|jgi:LacI family transcriptional regulator
MERDGEPKIVRGPITVEDVARLANVSVGTVSNVLNGSAVVSAKRRALVEQAARELGYIPNMLAGGLKRRQSSLIGVCVPHPSAPYFRAMSEKIESLTGQDGYDFLEVFSHHSPELEVRRLKTILKYRPGGMLLVPTANPYESLDLLAQAGVPTVILDRAAEDGRFDQVIVDSREAMRKVVRLLIDNGHRSIVFLTENHAPLVTRNRLKGFRDAIRQAEPRIFARIRRRADAAGAMVEQIDGLMGERTRPTAIIVSNTAAAAWVVKALRVLEIRCPQDMSLVSVDDPGWASLVQPSLTVVRQPTTQLSQIAWKLLRDRLRGVAQEPQRVLLDAEIVHGESVGPAPGTA